MLWTLLQSLLMFTQHTVLLAPTVQSFYSTGTVSRSRQELQNEAMTLLLHPPTTTSMMASIRRYGPPPSSNKNDNGNDDVIKKRNRLKCNFIQIIDAIVKDDMPENEIPSLLAKNIDVIMNVIGYSYGGGVTLLEEITQEMIEDKENSNESTTDGSSSSSSSSSNHRMEQVSNAIDVIMNFVESFVEQTKTMDDVYKQLLGKIFQSIAPSSGVSSSSSSSAIISSSSLSSSSTAADMENQLDNLLSTERSVFTPGFLRHIEGECLRIASLPTMSPESVKMLQILRLIQTRILEELGKDIGEGAIVLGQLLGYDDESERLAVLDAGLTVRGLDFAIELAKLTEEALDGFNQTGTRENVDAELVDRVRVIDDRIRKFIGKWTKDDFQ